MIEAYKCIPLEDLLKSQIQEEIRLFHLESEKKSSKGMFLDAVLDINGSRIFEYFIIHRLPDKKYTSGKIFLTAFDSTSDIYDGRAYFDNLAQEMVRITDSIRVEQSEISSSYIPKKPFDVDQIVKWMEQYQKIPFVKSVDGMVR